MPDSSKRGGILAKIESVYGTDPVPTGATNAIAVINPQYSADFTLNERDQILRDSLSRLSAVVGIKLARLTFGVEMKGSGTAGTPARHGVLHRMCGMSETVVAVTSVTYAPINSGFESGTVYWYDGSKLYKITGAYASCRIVEEVGNFGRFEFSVLGIWNQPTDAAIPSMTLDATRAQPVINLGLTIGGYTPVGSSLNIDMNVAIGRRLDFNSTTGLKGVQITGRGVGGTLDIETVTEATYPAWANAAAGTEGALAGNLISGSAGNRVAVTSPKIQLEAPQQAETESIRHNQIGVRFNPSVDSASDEISIAYS